MNQELPIKIVLDAWYANIGRTDTLFNSLTDEQLMGEVSPGRNRGIYLLGHITAVHDRMIPLLDLGPQLFTHLDDTFIAKPDKTITDMPSIADLRDNWKEVNATLANRFAAMQPSDWLQRHTSVSEVDFAKEPHRNKLNIIVSRTNHLASHFGQLLFLKK